MAKMESAFFCDFRWSAFQNRHLYFCCTGYRKGDEDVEGEGNEDGGDKAEEEEEDEEVLDEMFLDKTLLLQTFPGLEHEIIFHQQSWSKLARNNHLII